MQYPGCSPFNEAFFMHGPEMAQPIHQPLPPAMPIFQPRELEKRWEAPVFEAKPLVDFDAISSRRDSLKFDWKPSKPTLPVFEVEPLVDLYALSGRHVESRWKPIPINFTEAIKPQSHLLVCTCTTCRKESKSWLTGY